MEPTTNINDDPLPQCIENDLPANLKGRLSLSFVQSFIKHSLEEAHSKVFIETTDRIAQNSIDREELSKFDSIIVEIREVAFESLFTDPSDILSKAIKEKSKYLYFLSIHRAWKHWASRNKEALEGIDTLDKIARLQIKRQME